jgi:hypothetical protein
MRESESIALKHEERKSNKMNTVKDVVRLSLDTLHTRPKNRLSTINFKNNDIGYKTKSEFQRRLMSENNLIKYKSSCISLIKDDEDLKKLSEAINLTNIDKFVEVSLFSDSIFMYKLENILSADPIKNKREKFFKEEIKKILETIILEMECEAKKNKLNVALEAYINNIDNFKIL